MPYCRLPAAHGRGRRAVPSARLGAPSGAHPVRWTPGFWGSCCQAELVDVTGPEGDWRDAADRGVSALPVVEDLDV